MVRPFNPDFRYSGSLDGTTAIVAALVANGSTVKKNCRVATTGNVTIATALNAGDVIDGVTLADDDRVLVWQNSTASQNGVIVVGATPGRAPDFDSDSEIRGAFVPVLEGDTYGGRLFRNTNTAAIVVDTDDITFELFASTTSIPFDHGNMGATETFDLGDGDWHRATFNANCTITLQGFGVDVGATMLIEFTIGGAGGWSATWDPDAVFIGNDQPPQTAGDVGFLLLWTSQGDSLIYAAWIGAGGLTVKDEGVALATLAESIDFVGAGVVASGTGAAKTITISGAPTGAAGGGLSGTYPNPTVVGLSGLVGPILISDTPSTPLIFADLIQNEAQDDLVYADP